MVIEDEDICIMYGVHGDCYTFTVIDDRDICVTMMFGNCYTFGVIGNEDICMMYGVFMVMYLKFPPRRVFTERPALLPKMSQQAMSIAD